MSIEIVKENIYASKYNEPQSIQLPVQEDVIVPDVKPDIQKVLQVDSKITFDEINNEIDKVKFAGKVDFNILYLAEEANRSVHNISVSFPVEDFINVDNINKDSVLKVNGNVENVRVELLNSRKVNINSVVEVEALTEEKYQKSLIVDAKGIDDIQILRGAVSARQLVINKDEKVIVKDEIAVPTGKSNIGEILWCDIVLKNKDIKLLDDKVTVKGDLNVCILYCGDTEERNLEFIEKEVPFNGIVECKGCTPEMYPDIQMDIAKYYVQIMPDLDGEERVVQLEIITDLNVKIYQVEQKQVIDDIYSPSEKIVVEKDTTKLQNILFKNQMKANVNESFTVEKDLPDIMQVFYVSAKPKVEDVKVMEDKVMVEGVIFTNIYYIAADDNNPVCSFDEVIPFQQIIEARSARPENKVEIQCYVEYANCNMLSNREVEIRCNICFDTNVIEENEYDLIVDIKEEEKDMNEYENMPSVIIYCAGKDDTLWNIAKKYETTVDKIIEVNELEKDDNIEQGQKILIVKEVIDV